KFFRIPTLFSREIANVVLRLLMSEPSRCSGSRVDDDLHVLLVVVDELVESAGDELVETDSRGDECRQVDLAAFGELDRRRVVASMAERYAQVDLLQDEHRHVYLWFMASDRYVDDDATNTDRHEDDDHSDVSHRILP